MKRQGKRKTSSTNGAATAQAAGLRYTTDAGPGLRRQRAGRAFRYIAPDGRVVRDEDTLARLRSLAVPPAWTDVWISPNCNTHLQATGRDARGRKQYRYHAAWRAMSHQHKYERLSAFARALPRIRGRVRRDLRHASLCRAKVLAAVVQLLERTWIRVGNPEYARTNGSFGLTTLRDRHVRIRGRELQFQFVGKAGVRQAVSLADARLARLVKKCQELPGQELFQYVDADGAVRPVTSADVNAYLRDASGLDLSAKDFRTWAGTVLAVSTLNGRPPAPSARATRSTIVQAVETVAQHLGNTPAVCRTCYIHPAVFEAYANGTLRARLAGGRSRQRRGLSIIETTVLNLLETRRDWREQLAAAARLARRHGRAGAGRRARSSRPARGVGRRARARS